MCAIINCPREFVPAFASHRSLVEDAALVDEAAFADLATGLSGLAIWEMASERLAAGGRSVPVLHPSERHRESVIVFLGVHSLKPFNAEHRSSSQKSATVPAFKFQ